MIRHLYVLGSLLALALILSFVSTAKQTSPSAAGKIRLVDASEDTFEVLRWITPASTVELAARDDRHGRWYQVSVQRHLEPVDNPSPNPAPPEAVDTPTNDDEETEPVPDSVANEESTDEVMDEGPDAQATEEPLTGDEEATPTSEDVAVGDEDLDEPVETPVPPSPPIPDPEPRVVSFTGGIQALRLIEAVTPLLATRSIDRVPVDRLEAMGFENGDSRLEIVVRGRTHVFEIGGRTYGGGHQYLRRPGETTVHLVEATPFRPIEHGARRLMRREILPVRRGEIERVTVESADGRRVEMVQRGRQAEGPRSFFADASDPDRRVEEYGNWIGKILALRVFDYVADDAVPQDLDPVLLLSVYTEDSPSSLDLEIHKRVDPFGEEHWYARSDHTRFVVTLPRAAAASVAADLDGILGG